MKRKLLFLDVLLVAAIAYAGFQLRDLYRAAKAREAARLNQKVKPAPPPPLTPLGDAKAVVPADYANIAEKMLFDKSRNPTVVVEVVPPPPPKPVPPFPALKGMMNLGDGLTAVFAEKPGGHGAEVKPGEKIGQFTLVSVNEQEAVFGWEGKTFRKPVEEILDRSKPADNNTESTRAAAPQPPPAAAVVKAQTGPGAATGASTKACVPNDSTPAGTVVDGYKKVVVKTVFGEGCQWEAVAR